MEDYSVPEWVIREHERRIYLNTIEMNAKYALHVGLITLEKYVNYITDEKEYNIDNYEIF